MSERVPEPLEMSDTQILDWMNEYSYKLSEEAGIWHITYGINDEAKGGSVRDVVCRAARYWETQNGPL